MSEFLEERKNSVAIIGMSGRFPKANTTEELWHLLAEGKNCISHFTKEELLAVGIDQAEIDQDNYVRAWGSLDNIEDFDPGFFGFRPEEAINTHPQLRIFIECIWECLESAGYSPDAYTGRIGLFAGAAENDDYLGKLFEIENDTNALENRQHKLNYDRDYLSTQISYRLGLTGPSVVVKTACSTSLVAVHMACQSILNGESDMCLAGGVHVPFRRISGYKYLEGSIFSPDGYCRAYDEAAAGAVFGSGAGVVLLKGLADAIEDNDNILGIIRGTAINNDGRSKNGFTAPSVSGQKKVITSALEIANVNPESITYVESHGTGTKVGDPIEVQALTQAYREYTDKKGFCGIGSVKPNIGHLDAAAGIANLIKVVLALKHKTLPPSINFHSPNPEIDFENSPFYVNDSLKKWESISGPLRAGVSSFGFGGTNAHAIIEEAPLVDKVAPSRRCYPLVISANNDSSIEQLADNMASLSCENDAYSLADISHTLIQGRTHHALRRGVACDTFQTGAQNLKIATSRAVTSAVFTTKESRIVFMISGQGTQHVHMARNVYSYEPEFRKSLDRCAEILSPIINIDIRSILFPDESQLGEMEKLLSETQFTQPILDRKSVV